MTYDVHIPNADGTVTVERAGDYRAAVLLREGHLAALTDADQLTAKITGQLPFITLTELPE